MAEDVKRPSGLRARGRRYWDAVTGEFDLASTELELLRELCGTLDEIDLLKAVLRKDGVTTAGSKGQVVAHPVLVELRGARLLLSRLAGQLDLPDEDGSTVPTAASLRAKKAATDRWANVRQMRAGRG
jgi:hypothetical protein